MNSWQKELAKILNELTYKDFYVLGNKVMNKASYHKWVDDNLIDPEQAQWAHDWVTEM